MHSGGKKKKGRKKKKNIYKHMCIVWGKKRKKVVWIAISMCRSKVNLEFFVFCVRFIVFRVGCNLYCYEGGIYWTHFKL